MSGKLAVWFPAVRVGTGADIFTMQLCRGLESRGIRAEITWLPPRAEYAPHSVTIPRPPQWATIAHINTWLHPRFIPESMPVIATLHHSIHDPSIKQYKGAVRAAYHGLWVAHVEKAILHRADRIVAVSRFAARMAQTTLLNVPIEVIPNGIDTRRFHPGARSSGAGRPFRLLFVGGWKRLKGVDLLPRIMRELGHDYVLRYTGGEARLWRNRRLPANMVDVGRLETKDVIKLMQDSDALLLPSRSEGLPLVVMEAMSCGLPPIVSDASSLPEVVDHGVSGFLCARDDVPTFVNTIRMLGDHPDLVRRLSQASRELAVARFDQERMVDSYVRHYATLVR